MTPDCVTGGLQARSGRLESVIQLSDFKIVGLFR